MPNLYISVILRYLIMNLETKGDLYQNEKKLSLLNNCYKTIEFLITVEKFPPFKILSFESEIRESGITFTTTKFD